MTGKPRLSHIDDDGKAVMVDVSDKGFTNRIATAAGSVEMKKATMKLIEEGGLKKGDVVSVARLAGILGAKKTPELIPLCHPLSLQKINVEITLDPTRNAVDIEATCKVNGQTGVEMEALTAVSVAALTIYDMCKAVDRNMRLTNIRLCAKSGGQSGDFIAGETSS
jgi:cyclic pyranopterin phosphate synthase